MADNKNESYLPVPWEYREVVEEEISKRSRGKIFFFDANNQVAEAKGSVTRIEEKKSEGVFVVLDTGSEIRIDRIITLFGKIGAAYNEYDAYANACLDCLGGYEKEDL
ncbi:MULTISPECIES: hypothetical protein [Olivibacter]|jgi:hypothetical protein|uniref:Uncharacterized protein n=2 Tax=Olivibacter TaxID=376469 RepID=A0ABV6HPR5_9SPHI|nr:MULTISPECIES: hypothetical protein [Olivibacter]MCL4640631.1 hypothetical protein [Olivibacter sp. UJ_SKK_5.1]MDM8173777.1 hypothetical protein [Olivibacter sp. 47]MDX3914963.1 hypothetical protein [Pseudosphingobacterium sp.]QEL03571.1 hypothetical protein FKG96_22965 [Olivibacter sp. LS-1]